MNVRFGLIAGAAVACAVVTGCKAPKANTSSGATASARPVRQSEVKTVEKAPQAAPSAPAEVQKPEPLRCKCTPGTVHESPCMCGASDCKCKVVPPAPEYTLYRVKSGDTLSAICVEYGLKQKNVLDLNPGLSPNKIYAGKKIKLPGKIELKGDDAKPVAIRSAAPAKASAGKARSTGARASAYTGATKVYVVKSGDTLGKLAIDNGVTVKCLMDMNGLKSRVIRIGQKLKVPAEKPVVVAAKKPAAAKPEAKAEKKDAVAAEPAAKPDETAPVAVEQKVEKEAEQVAAPTSSTPEPVAAAPAAAEEAESPKTHTVKEGEDVVSIAIAYGVSPSAIFDLNNIKGTDAVEPGTVLKLPANAKAQ